MTNPQFPTVRQPHLWKQPRMWHSVVDAHNPLEDLKATVQCWSRCVQLGLFPASIFIAAVPIALQSSCRAPSRRSAETNRLLKLYARHALGFTTVTCVSLCSHRLGLRTMKLSQVLKRVPLVHACVALPRCMCTAAGTALPPCWRAGHKC